jgi:curved DNA-binding protein CbpA
MNPFEALGLPARPDLTDEQVRAAWRAIAAATHPDRPDGGDLAVYTAASAAYAELRTPWSRSEAYADVTERAARAGQEPDTSPLPAIRDAEATPPPPWQPLLAVWQLPARVRRGRPLHLAIRAIFAAVLAMLLLQLIPGSAAAPADVIGIGLWFVLSGRRYLAPPPER